MKMTNEDYKELSNKLDKAIKKAGIESIKEHRKLKLGMDIEKRFRWDLTFLLKPEDITKYYHYLNDDNIDSVLKKYVKEHKELLED